MRVYKMGYKSYAEVRCLSLEAYSVLFRTGDIFKVTTPNKGEINIIVK